jgi:hypothetical protein
MIALKRQREDYYSDFRDLLKKKLLEKTKTRQRNEFQGEKRGEPEW